MKFGPPQLKSPALWVFLISLALAFSVGHWMPTTWVIDQASLQVEEKIAENGEIESFAYWKGKEKQLSEAIAREDSPLSLEILTSSERTGEPLPALEQFVYELDSDGQKQYYHQYAYRHWHYWSFLPALTAIMLCWMTKEPISALVAGIVIGAFLMGKFDILSDILIPSIGTESSATILILYLWLLGGLNGMWTKTGASEAFADYVSARFVRGPISAKVVAWFLGVLFFQGGTISAVLVGTTVRPLADEEKVSHEELSLIVDSTSSPIAVILAFNAWPLYVQAFMTVAGASYLATLDDRIAFFFSAVPFSFYAMFAVLATFLVAIEKHPFLPKKLKMARQRARETGQLNAPGAEPLANEDPNYDFVPAGYQPHVLEFVLPLVALLGVAVVTYIVFDSPNVLWSFGSALILSGIMAWLKGMNLREIVFGILEGQKGVILGSVILLLAITIGKVSQDVGGGRYLVSLLGNFEWHWLLPVTSFLIAVVIAFSTGTSWATFAVTMPLVMPLAHTVALNQELAHPELYMAICFAACLNGGVFGDQCSPISDTTILSSMCTGADLMDHVKTQIPVACQAAFLAIVGWTAIAFYC